jgi:hypothetical protein
MKNQIKWLVEEAPTGRYRSFHRRGWPTAKHKITGRTLFSIGCEDDYINGKPPHGLLSLRVAKSNENDSWDWVVLKRKFETLAELKAAAIVVYQNNLEWFK